MKRDARHGYVVAGLTVRSDIELPELMRRQNESGPADIEIRSAPVPESLPEATQVSMEAEITDEAVLLKIPGVARYHISGGNRILVEAESGVEARNLRLFLLGSAFGAIYFQRGLFPLHASVVVVNGGAAAFTGESGAGKSTMATWMNSQGYPLLCDDVCVVRFDDQRGPLAYPGYPRLKLWRDALDALSIDTGKLQRDYFRADKYHLTVPERFWIDPVPLAHINFLEFSDTVAVPRIEPIQPAQAVHLIRNNTYRYQFISSLGLTKDHFLDCVKLARSVGTNSLIRPRNHAKLAECQRLIEQQMQ